MAMSNSSGGVSMEFLDRQRALFNSVLRAFSAGNWGLNLCSLFTSPNPPSTPST
ncbi:hypothetical protein RchiOBHm_Chr3g0479151 [Rosa chinensis]|uniref:Uncharacterized protein n=1 Tax=Rosa chinensis TaxID=74649 RepID=A0A2P6RDA4_ROSCH|nr:hypothetical protein RchiOBHm_Chr3g0479151 [Rosa chinensis]